MLPQDISINVKDSFINTVIIFPFSMIFDHLDTIGRPTSAFTFDLQIKYLSHTHQPLCSAKCCTVSHVLLTSGWLKMTRGREPSSEWADRSPCSCHRKACCAVTVISPFGLTGRGRGRSWVGWISSWDMEGGALCNFLDRTWCLHSIRSKNKNRSDDCGE